LPNLLSKVCLAASLFSCSTFAAVEELSYVRSGLGPEIWTDLTVALAPLPLLKDVTFSGFLEVSITDTQADNAAVGLTLTDAIQTFYVSQDNAATWIEVPLGNLGQRPVVSQINSKNVVLFSTGPNPVPLGLTEPITHAQLLLSGQVSRADVYKIVGLMRIEGTPVLPIPEPGAWLMILSGLGLCAVLVRYKNRNVRGAC
jgi:hypothetical protein